jgi:ATP-dependent helicase/DNAse subunit B
MSASFFCRFERNTLPLRWLVVEKVLRGGAISVDGFQSFIPREENMMREEGEFTKRFRIMP